MLRDIIIRHYREAVALSTVPDELKRSLKTNERIPSFIDNLHRELAAVPNLSAESIQTTVYDLTMLTLDMIEKQARENYLTEAAKSAMRDAERKQTLKDTLADRINAAPDDAPAEITEDELGELTDG